MSDIAKHGFEQDGHINISGEDLFRAEAAKLSEKRGKMVTMYRELHSKYANNPAWNVLLNNMHKKIVEYDKAIVQNVAQAEQRAENARQQRLAEAGIESPAGSNIRFSDELVDGLRNQRRAERLAGAMSKQVPTADVIDDGDDEGLDVINGPRFSPNDLHKLQNPDDVAAKLLGRNNRGGLRSSLHLPGRDLNKAA